MKATPLALAGLMLVEPRLFGDARGFFMESWNQRNFADIGIDALFVQDNHSRSAAGVLRGLHYQLTRPQGKLVRVTRGRAFDVAVDMRRASPTFGRWQGAELSADNHLMFWIPPGFAHGFLSLEDDTEFQYKCTDFYAPEDEHSLLWNDPALGIDWPLDGLGVPALSDKDRAGRPLADAPAYS